MKRLVCCALLLSLLFLAGCSGKTDITGVWEQEMEISILGNNAEVPAAAMSTLRFTFREDGTGSQEVKILDGVHPDSVRAFSYTLEGETLILDYGEQQTEEFTVLLKGDSLRLENRRGAYDLTKEKE